MKRHDKPKHAFLLAGLSESGKSYTGNFFDKHGVRRLKYVRLFAHEVLNKEPHANPYKLLENSTDSVEEQVRMAAKALFEICEAENILFCSLESMVKPSTTIAMRNAIRSDRISVVYFDVDEETRLRRQMGREGVDFETARRIMLPRDQKKIQFGTPLIRDIADIVIDNRGSKEKLDGKLMGLINLYCA